MGIREYIKENILVLDGGMGTLLQAEGLGAGERPERWCLDHRDVIVDIHRRYFEAGARVVSANTFGANILKYGESELEAVVCAAISCAREAQSASGVGESWVALDVGPTGRMLEPLGDLGFEEAVAVFSRTVELGVKYGADLIFIETMSDSCETKAALLAAKECSTLPVFVSCAYNEDGTLLTGGSPESVVAMLEGMGADAVGVNCSLGPRALSDVVRRYLACASVPVILKANAGLPRCECGATVYDIDAEQFASETAELVLRGASIVGGCCGTTPEYIRALCERIRNIEKKPTEDKGLTVVSSYCRAVRFGQTPVLIGERINPTGKKRFKEALRERDIDYILREGLSQAERGVQLLDVNVGLPEIDEGEMLTMAIRELQSVCDLPLQIDTSDYEAMERALRVYNGKALINSVSGKRESMERIFPLAKKYGGVIIALTLDDDGIPETAEGRVRIAEKILCEAQKWGIEKKDIIFDPLALTVSADKNAARETLRAIGMIRDRLGALTSLGVSNVSFGLPARDTVNSTFFSLALGRGLSAAIINPYSVDIMRTYHAYLALAGLDDNCAGYIEFASTLTEPNTAVIQEAKKPEAITGASELEDAIVRGLRERAAALTRELVRERDPLDIVSGEIVPALDRVGVAFENKSLYLPSLLMSAEAAGAAFEVIREAVPKGSSERKYPIVLATVKGDIHDIGKNIVRLLLENYGYEVHDLGRDVPPERIVAQAQRTGARLVGLSALMTTTVPAMEETIGALRAALPDVLVVVGGAVLTEEYAAVIGADKYARDAMEAVRY
ncbi:MAG: homocysteine S-methyltransferase family protein, partial [Clostridia bacterium]|nr:homocysteine S-methyltransferase family protein [Clostridia bacterium]